MTIQNSGFQIKCFFPCNFLAVFVDENPILSVNHAFFSWKMHSKQTIMFASNSTNFASYNENRGKQKDWMGLDHCLQLPPGALMWPGTSREEKSPGEDSVSPENDLFWNSKQYLQFLILLDYNDLFIDKWAWLSEERVIIKEEPLKKSQSPLSRKDYNP